MTIRMIRSLTLLLLMAISTNGLPLEETNTTTSSNKNIKYFTADDITQCNISDENLGECVKRQFNLLWPRLKNGDKELNIPAYDPFVLNRTTFQYTNGPVSGRITIKNTKIYGFSEYHTKNVAMKVDKDKLKWRIDSYLPKMNILGNYKANMSFNNVRIQPKGEFNVTLYDVKLDISADGELYDRDGHRFVRLIDFDATPTIGDLKIKANGLFPDPTLDELVLNVANQYWRDIYSIMLPETRLYWQPMVLRVANEALKAVPFDAYVKA